jgi:NAD(P)-dependent dehydrogenase (short-subunit alcohol dehydrogenase family)
VQIERMIELAVSRYGRIDALFLNAGIFGTPAPVADLSEAMWHQVLRVNLDGVFFGLRSGIRALRRFGGGRIPVTASIGGLTAAPHCAPYMASKHAVIGLVRTAALEVVREGIAINALCPGATDTAMMATIRATLDVPTAADGAGEDAILHRLPAGAWPIPANRQRLPPSCCWTHPST